jgi:hypothetical protein
LTGAKVVLTGVDDGAWSVQWWNTAEGKRVTDAQAVASDGRLRLEPPAFQADIAARLRKK